MTTHFKPKIEYMLSGDDDIVTTYGTYINDPHGFTSFRGVSFDGYKQVLVSGIVQGNPDAFDLNGMIDYFNEEYGIEVEIELFNNNISDWERVTS